MALFKKPLPEKEIEPLTEFKKTQVYRFLMTSDHCPGRIAHLVKCDKSQVAKIRAEILRIKAEMDLLPSGAWMKTAKLKISSNMLDAGKVIDDVTELLTAEGSWAAYQKTKIKEL